MVAVLGLGILLAVGVSLESLGGWVACPVQGFVEQLRQRQKVRGQHWTGRVAWRAAWNWLRRSWLLPLARSEGLLALVLLTDRSEWEEVCLLPWLVHFG